MREYLNVLNVKSFHLDTRESRLFDTRTSGLRRPVQQEALLYSHQSPKMTAKASTNPKIVSSIQ